MSLEAPNTPTEQKAYAYLLLGQLHYEKIDTMPTKVDKYTAAKLYYDSTVTSMNTFFENAEAIVERQKILSDFVKQLEIVDTEERLQNWAKLSPEELEKAVAEQMALDKAKKERELALQAIREKKAKENIATIDQIDVPQLGTAVFFAYDPVASATQKVKFEQKWGNRPLEDNWRRSDKEIVETIKPKAVVDTANVSQEDSLNNTEDSLKNKIEEVVLDKDSYTQNLPKDEIALQASNEKLMEASYQLGKIYYYNLLEIENAKEVFENYLVRFPDTKYEAEVIYFMYLICQRLTTCDHYTYKTLEGQKYPNSLYYRLMENKDYLTENEEENRISHNQYEMAFDLYKQNQFIACARQLDQIIGENPNTDILDKVTFLKILTYAQTDQVARYYSDLEQFVKDFGTSPLKNRALEILQNKPIYVQENLINEYSRADSSKHYFVALFKNNQMTINELDNIYGEFRKNYFKDLSLSTKTIEFSDSTYLYVNKAFSNFDVAKEYYDKLMHFHEFGEHLDKIDYSYYLVTEENYNRLITKKDIHEFEVFYQQNYRTKKR